MLKYLVTGTPRSGTVYMARLLTSLGFMCGHEAIFDTEGLDTARRRLAGSQPIETSYCSQHDILHNNKPIEKWFDPASMVAESSYMAAPFLGDECLAGTKVIHAVRNPLKVISSIRALGFLDAIPAQKKWNDFAFAHVPGLNEIPNYLERICRYYVAWNEMIVADFIHKVEGKCTPDLMMYLGVEPHSYFTDDTVNRMNDREADIKISDIPDGTIKREFIQLSERYGY